MYYQMPYYKPVIMRSPIYIECSEPIPKPISVLDSNIDSFASFSVQRSYYSLNRPHLQNNYKTHMKEMKGKVKKDEKAVMLKK